MVEGPLLVALKFLHVLAAAVWVGHGVAMNAVVLPVVNQATPGARRELLGRLAPVSFRFANVMGGFTLLSGLALVYGMVGNLRFEGSWGRLIAFGFVANLLILYLLNFALRPSFRAIDKLMADAKPNEPPPTRVVFLQKRIRFTSMLSLGLLLLALLAMVAANLGVEI